MKIDQRLLQNSLKLTSVTDIAIGTAIKNERFKMFIKSLKAMLFSFKRFSFKRA